LIQSLEENEDAPGVFFIFNKQWFDMFAYETLQNDLIKLRFRENTDPYLIYELAMP
jgi:hypothetical protein